MRKQEIQFITEIGIFSALGLVLSYLGQLLSGFLFPAGGELSLILVPIIIIAYRRGFGAGILTGFIVGTVQLMWATGDAKVHPIQIILDYSIAFSVVGIAGLFRNIIYKSDKKMRLVYVNLSAFIAGMLRLLVHIFTGAIWFIGFTNGVMKAIIASIAYNLTYMIPSVFLTLAVLTIIILKQPDLILPKESGEYPETI